MGYADADAGNAELGDAAHIGLDEGEPAETGGSSELPAFLTEDESAAAALDGVVAP